MITGLVCFELYKVVLRLPLDRFRNAFVNLAIPLTSFAEPLAPAKHTSQLVATKTAPATRCVPEGRGVFFCCFGSRVTTKTPKGWTVWDTIDIFGDVTVKELIDIFEVCSLLLDICFCDVRDRVGTRQRSERLRRASFRFISRFSRLTRSG